MTPSPCSASFLQDALASSLGSFEFSAELDRVGAPDDVAVESATTFEEAGVLTTNKGLVLRMEDGSEYQLTIVRSR